MPTKKGANAATGRLRKRTVHRVVTVFVVAFTLYLGLTGTLIQLIDLRSLFTQASAFDPNVRAMRESFDGPGAFQVIATGDHVAPVLPPDADLRAMTATTVEAARAELGDAPLRFLELRVAGGKVVGQVRSGDEIHRFDAKTGAPLGLAPPGLNEDQPPLSERNTVKQLHRMTVFGNTALWINVAVSAALAVLIVTGIVVYAQLVAARSRAGFKGLLWSGGGAWKTLHRAVAVVAAVFLIVVTLSGAWLAVESLIFGYRMGPPRPASTEPAAPRAAPRDASAPLKDADIPSMLQATLEAYRKAEPDAGLRVIRLRDYKGAPQGGVVTGGKTARQLVFDLTSGKRVASDRLGYYPQGFPFGWQAHQIAKRVHRGDIIGMPGRFMDLIAGLAMLYLSVSGIVMYARLWNRRRVAGRKGLLWA